VYLPRHLFVRLRDETGEIQIEPATGQAVTTEEYMRKFGLKDSSSVRALTTRQLVAMIMNQVAGGLGLRSRIKEATDLLERALAIDRSLPFPWYNLGYSLLMQGKFRHGLECIERAIHLHEEVPDFWIGRAIALHQAGCRQEARKSVDRALGIPVRVGSEWARFALILNAWGLHGSALRCIERALLLDPRNSDFHEIEDRIAPLVQQ
jgi:tetratricopeptide (TPR) repeat protein